MVDCKSCCESDENGSPASSACQQCLHDNDHGEESAESKKIRGLESALADSNAIWISNQVQMNEAYDRVRILEKELAQEIEEHDRSTTISAALRVDLDAAIRKGEAFSVLSANLLIDKCELERKNDILLQDRKDYSTSLTKEGMNASEWIWRAGKAEREARSLKDKVDSVYKVYAELSTLVAESEGRLGRVIKECDELRSVVALALDLIERHAPGCEFQCGDSDCESCKVTSTVKELHRVLSVTEDSDKDCSPKYREKMIKLVPVPDTEVCEHQWEQVGVPCPEKLKTCAVYHTALRCTKCGKFKDKL